MNTGTGGKAERASGPVVVVNGLARAYTQGGRQQVVLDNVSFTLNRGERVALLGRSGCGKTTLLNLLSGMDRFTSGSICIDGVEISRLGERERTLFRRRHIGFIYQFFNLVPGLTALENVALMAELNGHPVRDALTRGEHILSLLGLAGKAGSYPEQLSGGEQQRVAIARALVHSPSLLLADEPTGNLDAASGQEVLQVLGEHLQQHATTTLIVTHSLAVARTADRILTLENGRVEERSGDFAW